MKGGGLGFNRQMIGVLGGMGPSATISFYNKLIEISQKNGAMKNEEFPLISIYNLPVYDLIGSDDKKNTTFFALLSALKKIQENGADFIVIPCNTVHLFLEEFRKNIDIPIISIIEETVKKIINSNVKKVGILGTYTTLKTNIYQNKLEEKNIGYIVPEEADIKEISNIISKIVAGLNTEDDKETILEIINKLVEQGAEGIILGCTELSLIIKQGDISVSVFDTLEILAESSLKKYFGVIAQPVRVLVSKTSDGGSKQGAHFVHTPHPYYETPSDPTKKINEVIKYER